ncbi:MAG: histidine kinase N-terminal 7TM domain-containing protein [Oscillochloridaceae bacterium umkhey_bin13]
MALNPYALSMLIAAAIVGAVAWYAWQRRTLPGGTAFALMMAALTLWSLAYGFELASLEFGLLRMWTYVQYLGIATAPPLWLIFTLRYSLLFEELRDPVLVVDQSGRLVDLNSAARHTLALDVAWSQHGPTGVTLATWPALAALCAAPGDASAEVRLATDPQRCFDAVSAPVRDQRGRAA